MRTFSSSGKRAQRTTDNCCSKEKRRALFFKHTEWNDIVCQPSMWLIFFSFARAHSGNICYHSIHAKLWNMIQKMDISTICHDDVVCCNNGPSFSRSPFLFLRSLWQNKYLSRTSKSLRTATRIAIIRADSICIDSPHWNNDILFKKKTNLVHISNVVSIFNLNSIQWFCVEHACCSFFFSSSSHFFLQKKTLFAFNIFSMWLLQSLFYLCKIINLRKTFATKTSLEHFCGYFYNCIFDQFGIALHDSQELQTTFHHDCFEKPKKTCFIGSNSKYIYCWRSNRLESLLVTSVRENNAISVGWCKAD